MVTFYLTGVALFHMPSLTQGRVSMRSESASRLEPKKRIADMRRHDFSNFSSGAFLLRGKFRNYEGRHLAALELCCPEFGQHLF